MSAEWLEVGRIFGLILIVWFALVGWRLLPLNRGANRPTTTPTSP
jgi:hypothetical protein